MDPRQRLALKADCGGTRGVRAQRRPRGHLPRFLGVAVSGCLEAHCPRGSTMAQLSLNPLKTCKSHSNLRAFYPQSPVLRHKLKFKPKNLSFACRSLMSGQSQDQKVVSLDALMDGTRKEEIFSIIEGSLSNCLSETNLQLTVPGLKSKTRGKVNTFISSKGL